MPATITLNYAFPHDYVMPIETVPLIITVTLKENWKHPESLIGLLETLKYKGYITYTTNEFKGGRPYKK